MNEQTAWEKAASADGTTATERALANLARKAFLSLWSYANVFTDEGRANGRGDGKELCDLLVVFGNDVLLFSDKDCAFRSDIDVTVAWPRWYRSAIEKSAKQLTGAEKFLKSYPKRVFLTRAAKLLCPLSFPTRVWPATTLSLSPVARTSRQGSSSEEAALAASCC